MRGRRTLAGLGLLAILGTMSSGCAVRNLKEANRRLKESNDRLISENNRLEHELASFEQELELLRTQELEGSTTTPAAYTQTAPEDIFPRFEGSEVTEDSEGIHVRFPDRIFFGLGQAKLTSKGQAVLRRVADVLQDRYAGHLIRVEGHTDDIPVRKVRHLYPSNWELSTARACTVVRYLVDEGGISPQRIYPAGFAYYRPLARGSTSKARRQNRRVEITILRKKV